MKGGKAGRKRRPSGDAAARRSGGKANQPKGDTKRSSAPKKGARKKAFGARSTADED